MIHLYLPCITTGGQLDINVSLAQSAVLKTQQTCISGTVAADTPSTVFVLPTGELSHQRTQHL